MRTDVKVGLICGFALVLLVVIYFVLQGNARPNAAQASSSGSTRAQGSAGAPGGSGLQVAPATAPAAEVRGIDVIPSAPLGQLAQAGSGMPVTGPGVGGGLISPPSPSSPVAGTQPGSTLGGGTPMNPTGTSGLAGGSIIPPSPPTPSPGSSGGLTSPGSDRETIELGSHGSSTPGSTGTADLRSRYPSYSGGGTYSSGGYGSTTPGDTGAGSSTHGSSTYTIQKGDMLGTIAKQHGVSVKALEAANPGVDATRLKIGKSINIPAAEAPSVLSTPPASTRPSARSSAHGSATGSTVSAAAHSSSAAKPGTSYTVKKGDTLAKIAQSVYGDKNVWRRIFRADRGDIEDADVLPIGTVLKLPS